MMTNSVTHRGAGSNDTPSRVPRCFRGTTYLVAIGGSRNQDTVHGVRHGENARQFARARVPTGGGMMVAEVGDCWELVQCGNTTC
jgi:hypothetical protein